MNPAGYTIKEIQEGKMEAFKWFFESFHPSLLLFAKRYLDESEPAPDIVQDAFINFWNKRKEIFSLDHARSYLYLYVKSKSLNFIRDKKHVTFPRLEMLDSFEYYKEALIIEEANEIIYQAIYKLSPQGKEVIELSLDGLKNEEIAQKLGITINTVKTIKQRAFKFLRKELKENVFALFLILEGQHKSIVRFSN